MSTSPAHTEPEVHQPEAQQPEVQQPESQPQFLPDVEQPQAEQPQADTPMEIESHPTPDHLKPRELPRLADSDDDDTPSESRKKPKKPALGVVVKGPSAEVFFQLSMDTPMVKLMRTYCDREGVDIRSLRFLYDGIRLIDSDTPKSLGLEEGDEIHAMPQQIGGHGRHGRHGRP